MKKLLLACLGVWVLLNDGTMTFYKDGARASKEGRKLGIHKKNHDYVKCVLLSDVKGYGLSDTAPKTGKEKQK